MPSCPAPTTRTRTPPHPRRGRSPRRGSRTERHTNHRLPGQLMVDRTSACPSAPSGTARSGLAPPARRAARLRPPRYNQIGHPFSSVVAACIASQRCLRDLSRGMPVSGGEPSAPISATTRHVRGHCHTAVSPVAPRPEPSPAPPAVSSAVAGQCQSRTAPPSTVSTVPVTKRLSIR